MAMAYADGFLVPVPTKNLAAYRKMSEKAGKIWMEHGALDYKECAGDDLTPEGMRRTFPRKMRLKRGQTLIFSWIVYESKAERDRILKLVMADPRMIPPDDMPFDPKYMLYGGFNVIVDMLAAPKPRAAKKVAKKPPRKKAAAKAAKAKARR